MVHERERRASVRRFRETSQMSFIQVKYAATALLLSAASSASAEIYSDPANDMSTGDLNLDLTSVEVQNDDDFLYFDIVTAGFADWSKYMIFMDLFPSSEGGASGIDNPWLRNVDMGVNTIDVFTGIWVDGGGGSQSFARTSSSDWSLFGTDSVSVAGTQVSIRFSLDALDLGVGDVIKFDIGTTGGNNGDPAIDLLSVGSTTVPWGGGTATAGELRNYTVVPAPGALALLGLAGVSARRRRA